MRRKSGPQESAEQHIKTIRRATRKRYSTEEKIWIVMSGLRGEYSDAELCRREGIVRQTYTFEPSLLLIEEIPGFKACFQRQAASFWRHRH